MNVYLYSGMQKLIEKSGVGRALYHQREAAGKKGIIIVTCLAEADILHINTVFPKSLWMAKLAKRKGIPVIYHAHSTKEDFKNSFLGSNLFDGLFGKWIKVCYNSADAIITPTEYAKQLLLGYGIKKRIEVISNGIDLDYYNTDLVDRNHFREKFGYGKDDKIIMSAGLIIDRKGIEDFVKLAEYLPQYKFIWFGETNLYTVPGRIRKAVKTKVPNLRFAGYVTKEILREAYGSCDLFLFPSKEETEGIVVLEALAMKIPVLLRDIPVYSDWLEKGKQVYKAGDFISFVEQSVNILEYKYPSVVEEGYRVLDKRSLNKVGQQLNDYYREIISENRVRSENTL